MRPSALLFLAALAGSVALWFLAVLPLHGEAADLAAAMEGADISGARERARAWPGPTEDEAKRLEESLAAYARPVSTVPLPEGLSPDGNGGFAGQIPWSAVQDLLAWAAEQPRTVLSIEVAAVAGNRERASCRIALGKERGR